jgi:hypothetical protein
MLGVTTLAPYEPENPFQNFVRCGATDFILNLEASFVEYAKNAPLVDFSKGLISCYNRKVK